jgi:hypothetical protein
VLHGLEPGRRQRWLGMQAVQDARDAMRVAVDVRPQLQRRNASVASGQLDVVGLGHDHRCLDRAPWQILQPEGEPNLLRVGREVVVVENEFSHSGKLALRGRSDEPLPEVVARGGFREDCIGVVSGHVAAVEELPPDPPFGIDQHGPGMRNPSRLAAVRLLVTHSERVDGVAARVREQWKDDVALFRECRQGFGGVVADRDQLHSALVKLLDAFLQLDQLPLAEGSPVRGAKEDDRQLAARE